MAPSLVSGPDSNIGGSSIWVISCAIPDGGCRVLELFNVLFQVGGRVLELFYVLFQLGGGGGLVMELFNVLFQMMGRVLELFNVLFQMGGRALELIMCYSRRGCRVLELFNVLIQMGVGGIGYLSYVMCYSGWGVGYLSYMLFQTILGDQGMFDNVTVRQERRHVSMFQTKF